MSEPPTKRAALSERGIVFDRSIALRYAAQATGIRCTVLDLVGWLNALSDKLTAGSAVLEFKSMDSDPESLAVREWDDWWKLEYQGMAQRGVKGVILLGRPSSEMVMDLVINRLIQVELAPIWLPPSGGVPRLSPFEMELTEGRMWLKCYQVSAFITDFLVRVPGDARMSHKEMCSLYVDAAKKLRMIPLSHADFIHALERAGLTETRSFTDDWFTGVRVRTADDIRSGVH